MRVVVTNNNKERDATTWLGTIVWISLGPRKQLLGSKWHKSECATSTLLVNLYHCNTTNTRRPHKKCKRATSTGLVDTGTREPLRDNMTTRVVSHLLGVSSQLTTPENNIWDSTGNNFSEQKWKRTKVGDVEITSETETRENCQEVRPVNVFPGAVTCFGRKQKKKMSPQLQLSFQSRTNQPQIKMYVLVFVNCTSMLWSYTQYFRDNKTVL